jgi:hypothetical protein
LICFDNTVMTFRDRSLIARVRGEYREMPGLCLTLPQACRLWQIEPSRCKSILDLLVAEKFLSRTAAGAFVATRLRVGERGEVNPLPFDQPSEVKV